MIDFRVFENKKIVQPVKSYGENKDSIVSIWREVPRNTDMVWPNTKLVRNYYVTVLIVFKYILFW
jgi:hypothetical protein